MPTSIRHILEKLKSWLSDDTFFYSVLLILIALASFGLGRQSILSQSDSKNPINKDKIEVIQPVEKTTENPPKTEESPTTPLVSQQPASVISAVVGSKSGTKYHLPDCPGAKRIKPENLISFATIEAAKAAGYTPAANCPGLR